MHGRKVTDTNAYTASLREHVCSVTVFTRNLFLKINVVSYTSKMMLKQISMNSLRGFKLMVIDKRPRDLRSDILLQ